MDIVISPSRLHGEIRAVASKSDAHRSIICAALADSPTAIKIDTLSDDICQTVCCVEALGARVDMSVRGLMRITPVSFGPRSADCPGLDCGESGSTLRFLLPVAAALGKRTAFTGRGRLPDRPLSPLLEEMERHGCRFSSDKLPFTVEGPMQGGNFNLPGNVSSQFVSGLLFALPLTGSGGSISLSSPPESSGYIDMTVCSMERFGISIIKTENGYKVHGGQKYRSPGETEVEGDWSNSAFWLVAGALSGEVACTGLNLFSVQGDSRIADILQSMGATIYRKGIGVAARQSPLHAIEIDASGIPDLIPVLSVAASVADGTTVIRNASRLRLKESDRLHAITDCLTRIGAQVRELDDGLIITGKKELDGGTVDGYNDHRIVMAMAVASTVCKSKVIIRRAEAVSKSYPHFFEDFRKLGGMADVIHNGTES